MKSQIATCAILAGSLVLCGCKTVKYPGASDESAPSAVDLTLETEPDSGNQTNPQYDKHRLHAAMRPAGSSISTMATATVAENETILIRVTARDDESGIKTLRVAGMSRLCQSGPGGTATPVEYQADREWAFKDFAPNGKGRIPKQAVVQNKVSIAPLLRVTRPDGTVASGDNASFQFSVEVVNGSGRQSSTQWLEYRVGKVACP